MHKMKFCAGFVFILAICTFLTSTNKAAAQTRVDFEAGTWVPFLPDYTAGSIVNSGFPSVVQADLFRDDQIDAGAQLGLNGRHHFGQSGKFVAVDLDIAGIGSMGSSGTFADPGPTQTVWLASLDGAGVIATPNGESASFSLDSNVLHYSEYIGIHDTFRLRRLGNLELGLGFGHMGFDQNFDLDAQLSNGASGRYVEQLNTTYLGGEIRGRLQKNMGDYSILLDIGLGLYNMDADYTGNSELRASGGGIFDTDQVLLGIDETAMTLDLGLKVDTQFRGVVVRPGIHFKYISDMPVINHPMTEFIPAEPVELDSDPGYFLGVNLEILMCCRCNCCCK